MPSQNVLADPQFTTVRILRPYAGFEADYNGTSVLRPVMVSEVLTPPGGVPRDALASKRAAGYNTDLIAGTKVPLGARVVLWFPKIVASSRGTDYRYIWAVQWRLRNTYDFREARIPYHFPKQGEGAPDGTLPMVVIPASDQTVIYTSPNPLGTLYRAVQAARTEDYSFGGNNLLRPFLPGGVEGVVQQGILNTALGDMAVLPSSQIIEIQATGDEILLGAYRSTDAGLDWDFAAVDKQFAQLLGDDSGAGTPYADLGVYIICGSSP